MFYQRKSEFNFQEIFEVGFLAKINSRENQKKYTQIFVVNISSSEILLRHWKTLKLMRAVAEIGLILTHFSPVLHFI